MQLPDNDRDDLAFRLLIIFLTLIAVFSCLLSIGGTVWIGR